MTRDSLKKSDYYISKINNLEKRLEKRIHKINNGLIKNHRIKIVKRAMSGQYLNLFKLKYSLGTKTDELYYDLINSIKLLFNNWEPNIGLVPYKENGKQIYLNQYGESYLTILELLSIAVLLDIEDDVFLTLKKYIDRDKVEDFLFEFLIKYKYPKRKDITKESYRIFFGINDLYYGLKKIIKEEDKTKASKELKYFLEKEWYPSFKGTPLYDQHLNLHNTYVGYWCFVAAAIVKIMELDDSSFRDNPYYPKDLL